MKISIRVANLTQKRIKPDFARKIIRKTAELAKSNLKTGEISAVFVSKKEIQKINQKYRQKNKSTDVLSFNYPLGYNKKNKRSILGEIILCPEVIEKSAGEHEVSFQKELTFVLSHGVLHLLGFRHGKKMYEMQDKISNLKF